MNENEFSQDELKKLAEIAGVWNNIVPGLNGVMGIVDGLQFTKWQPAEDLNQAFKCLDGLKKHYQITHGEHSEAIVYVFSDAEHSADVVGVSVDRSKAVAICKAVLDVSESVPVCYHQWEPIHSSFDKGFYKNHKCIRCGEVSK